ncbi:hypothetical protein OsccyDRAFT_0203 [Leptolyngbyaceae cyanobacterium JSC-12]|nr:hypothetical protein OsccyDRAFT_0203 [Leptolyngbyaceae cyanobacterium JSC-12]
MAAMPSKVNDQIPRSIMLLCLGTATVLVLSQWGGVTERFTPKPIGIVRAERKRQLKSEKTQAEAAMPKPTQVSQPASVSTSPKTDVRLVVNLSDRRVYLYKAAKLQTSYPLAVAQAGWETPTGTFQILNMERDPTWIHPITGVSVPPGVDNPLGVAWIGFWTDGDTEIGFHGTNQEELIGEAVSHGCLRMRNADIEALYAQVSTGTPVVVEP